MPASAAGLVETTLQMSGSPPADLDAAAVKTVRFEIGVGLAWLQGSRPGYWRLPLLIRARPLWPALAMLSGVALGTLAWDGHVAMDDGAAG